MIHGNNTPAVAVCVYGNRDYDDALLEIKDTLNGNGFRTFAAGAFIGRHCIFPKVAEGRPDASDLEKLPHSARDVPNCLPMLPELTPWATLK